MARQQVLVVGLGQFGMALAESLSRLGTEVVAVDHRPERVQLAASIVSEAVTMDAMDEAELGRLRPGARDLCVCAIGDENREASIIVTAMLRQMGAKRLVARTTDEMHERILRLVGAHEVLNPERLSGERLAARLAYQGLIEVVPLGDDLFLTELKAPASTWGRSLAQLHLPHRFQLTVLAVRRKVDGAGVVLMPAAGLVLASGDMLVTAGPQGAAQRLAKEG
ncbi:MAG: TrkA family potassium uptake protein [Deltaproteobacteria bacterium]|nr:TrkA family potassium uptake protein [Deltaproteobacteria bacterium]